MCWGRDLSYDSAVCRDRVRYGRAGLRQFGVYQRDGPLEHSLSGHREHTGHIISSSRWRIDDLRDGIARLLVERYLAGVVDHLHV